MRSPSLTLGFLTYPVLAVKDRRLVRDKAKLQGNGSIPRLQNKPTTLPQTQLPIVNPCHAVAVGKARLAERPSGYLLRIMKTSVGNLRHREVGQLDLTDRKTGL